MKFSFALAWLLAVASAQAVSFRLEPLWNVTPGQSGYEYLTTTSGERGMDYNPTSGHLLVATRNTTTGAIGVRVLNGTTGANLGSLNTTGVSGGTFHLNMLGIADDGAIYGANLTVNSTTTPLKIYRWANEAAAPQVVYSGDVAAGLRFGDTFDVRGSGLNTQIAITQGSGSRIAVFQTADGSAFSPTVFNTGISLGGGGGVTFGADNTVWTKASGQALRLWSFDLGTGSILKTAEFTTANFPSGVIAIDADLTTMTLGAVQLATPDKAVLYDISNTSGTTLPLIDSENFATDNANGNGVGSVALQDNLAFFLDTNNGIAAFAVVPEPHEYALAAAAGLLCFALVRRLRAA